MSIILDGKTVAASIREENKAEIAALKETGLSPKLAVILVGNDPASVIYTRSIEKACINAGALFEHFSFKDAGEEDRVVQVIERLNADEETHGIMIMLPLPKKMNKQRILEAVSPLKDLDGVHPLNRAYNLSNNEGLFPSTPQSCIEIMLRNGITIEGKHTVLVGRGESVGKPLIYMLLNQNATVTICHSRTPDLAYHTRQADILIVAVGVAGMITADMVKPGAVVVDVGINEMADGSIRGDVDFASVMPVAGAITPVPGGVGSVTTSLIIRNLLKAIRLNKKNNK
ncbi:MAG: bifunctional 5,10-methylene-tetrahydrofolate dehydrogenase/5,10-methylene-tetrahydrofolate cyclohydrolase [Peptococcaceae bacterium]|jgi:methylenetetrahydrofolate dehydrogenase (NADP+)/methenyltetrahydrofolate cyclohydrolase|nr:bifunctional 5,10-methylene-tetrahydrofolate dehydrogenase/5,10-methylene-tetrahydrofolate cyclohydrolase [Peptococcaceae bacterium]